MLNLSQRNKKRIKPSSRGKIRNIYDLHDSLIIQTSDRVSAFDHVFKENILGKGQILTNISNHWFSIIKNIKNHLLEIDYKKFPKPFCEDLDFCGNSVWVNKAERINFECVVRGYLLGSGYKEYQEKGSVCDISLPPNIKFGEKLPEAIFTPTTKSDIGADEIVSLEEIKKSLGAKIACQLRDVSLKIYDWANEKLKETGIILLDTKFEFGFYKKELILIDEVLTPDSSRFCEKEKYELSFIKGQPPPSMDKQIIRNYLEKINWNKKPPLPKLPIDILEETKINYENIQRKILQLS